MTPLNLNGLRSRRALAVGAACAGAVALLLFGGWFWYSSYQTRGLGEYAEALTRAQASQSPDAPSQARAEAIRELEAALAEYPANVAAVQAAYELGNLRFMNREYAAARGAFGVALAKGATDTLRLLCRAGIAYAWESERDFPKAVEAFQAALDGVKPEGFLSEDLTLGLARSQELAGQKQAAVATYQRILKDFPRLRRADFIRTRLAELGVPSDP
jgi:tetratricopeptide (TPR) repeat protein